MKHLPALHIRDDKGHLSLTIGIVLRCTVCLVAIFALYAPLQADQEPQVFSSCEPFTLVLPESTVVQPGKTQQVPLSLCTDEPVRAFSLLITFDPGSFIEPEGSLFRSDPITMPAVQIGPHTLNTVIDVAPGKIRVIGLEPAQITDVATIGTLILAIAEDAVPATTASVDVTGSVYLSSGKTVTLSPAHVDITIPTEENKPDEKHEVFLPLIER